MIKSDFFSNKLTNLSWIFRKAQFQNSTWIRENKPNKKLFMSDDMLTLS